MYFYFKLNQYFRLRAKHRHFWIYNSERSFIFTKFYNDVCTCFSSFFCTLFNAKQLNPNINTSLSLIKRSFSPLTMTYYERYTFITQHSYHFSLLLTKSSTIPPFPFATDPKHSNFSTLLIHWPLTLWSISSLFTSPLNLNFKNSVLTLLFFNPFLSNTSHQRSSLPFLESTLEAVMRKPFPIISAVKKKPYLSTLLYSRLLEPHRPQTTYIPECFILYSFHNVASH